MRKTVLEYDIVIEQDENKVYVGSAPELPGCHTEGDTIDELLENMKEAIELYLEHTQEKVANPMKFVGIRKISLPKPSLS